MLATLQAHNGFERPELGLDYFRRAERAASTVPGITTTAWIAAPPGSVPVWQTLRVEPAQLAQRDAVIDVAAFPLVSADRLRFQLMAGRMFGGGDVLEACRVAIVNEIAARELFDNDAVGRVVVGPAGDRVEIVGVVARRPERAGRPTIFYAPDQTGTSPDLLGPKIFRMAARRTLATAALDENVVSANYFDAIGWPRVAGSGFVDDAAGGCGVAIVNQEAADRVFAGHAVGAAVIDAAGRRTDIIGVVRAAALRTSQRRSEPAIFYPMQQQFRPRMTLVAGTANTGDAGAVRLVPDAAATIGLLRRRLEEVSGGEASPSVTTLDAQLSRTALAAERIATVLVGIFAVTAVALGVLGLYGAMAEAARQRRREMAVRIALGAQRWRVVGRVMAEGARLAVAGAGAGLLGSVVVARWLAQATVTAGAPTVWTWVAAAAILAGAVTVASVLPARRSVMLNPFRTR
jgi:hypothetical protein